MEMTASPPTTTPSRPPTTIIDAAKGLAPEDSLDRKHRHGDELSQDERKELLNRRISVVKAGYSVARDYAGARVSVLEAVKAWLEKPNGKSAETVKRFTDSSDLVTMTRSKLTPAQQGAIQTKIARGEDVKPSEYEGELVPRAELGAKDRQAEYHLLRACFTRYSSDAAAGLRTIAYAGASMHERAQRPVKPGGWGHPFVVGLINAERR